MNFATLQHSVFLQALGSAILNSLWQGFILWVIYETINISYKTASSAFKNKLSTVLIFSSFAWFVATLVTALFAGDHILSANIVSPALATEPDSTAGVNFEPIIAYATTALPYLSVAYIFLLFFLMAKLLSSYRYVYLIANKRLVSPPQKLQLFATKVASQIGLSRKLSVWLSEHIDVPATIGFLKPVILIPVASINNLSDHQLEAIILHELSHIRRNDYITNLIISIIETVLFFNPFILLLSKVVKRERENCCDDFVIQYQYDPHSYASALLSLEQTRRTNLQLAIGAVSGKKQLLNRIKRITTNRAVSSQFNYGQKLIALVLVTGIICSIAWLSPGDNKANTVKNIEQKIQRNTKDINDLNTKSIFEKLGLEDQAATVKKAKEPSVSNSFSKPGKEPEVDEADVVPAGETGDMVFDGKIFDEKKLALLVNKELKNIKVNPGKDFLKLIPLKTLEELSLQHFDVNFNFDGMDKDLREAYKSLSAMDWAKIQNDINKSLMKIKNDKASKKVLELAKLYEEDIQQVQRMRKPATRSMPRYPALRKSFSIRDSLRNIEIFTERRTQKLKNWIEQSPEEIPVENDNRDYDLYYSFGLEGTPAPVFNAPGETNYFKSIPRTYMHQNIKIIVQAPRRPSEPKSKTTYHYSISRNYDEHTAQPEIVTSEVTMMPD